LPILVNIFLIDFSALPDHVLAIRVLLYLICILGFIGYRGRSVILAFRQLSGNAPVLKVQKGYYFLAIPFLLALYLIVEIAIMYAAGHLF